MANLLDLLKLSKLKWMAAERECNTQKTYWFDLVAEVKKAQKIFDALDQKTRYSKLPFSWYASVKVVLSGLSDKSWGDGEQKNTVTHLIVAEDFSAGRLTRKKDSFLCTTGGFGSPKESKKEYSVKVAGFTVDTVPHTITCKICLSRIERLLKPIDES